MNQIRLIIIDDHTLLRETWSFILNAQPCFSVVASASTAEKGIELCKLHNPDILMLDINLPGMNGLEAVPLLKKQAPGVKILGVSLHTSPVYATKMMQRGALGYITKNSSHSEMIHALHELVQGKKYICDDIKNILATKTLQQAEASKGLNALSFREVEIIDLVRKGFSSKEIAATIFISRKTVEVHRYNILRKLNLRNAAELVNFANQFQLTMN